ncbi:MAG: tetratricopeptide repeat protein, partial [Acidiferrobacterales bacterium]|nr:tetratricopeptide repeat protein [Acidiferrobacterales bacterium]
TTELQREILFWMAESKVALGKSGEAAELYLRSAYHGQPKGGDMWGQSARYHAAESLAKAGNLEDARTIYQELLRFTPDAKRRAIIERNLQQLWLRKHTTQAEQVKVKEGADLHDISSSAK